MADHQVVTTAPHAPGDPDPAAEDPSLPGEGEDLAALLSRVLEETGREQKELASEAGITYTRLNSWITRARGTTRIHPDDLRAIGVILRRWGGEVTTADLLRAVGRPVPGPTDEEREKRLLDIYRQLPARGQRALIEHADLLKRSMSA